MHLNFFTVLGQCGTFSASSRTAVQGDMQNMRNTSFPPTRKREGCDPWREKNVPIVTSSHGRISQGLASWRRRSSVHPCCYPEMRFWMQNTTHGFQEISLPLQQSFKSVQPRGWILLWAVVFTHSLHTVPKHCPTKIPQLWNQWSCPSWAQMCIRNVSNESWLTEHS